MNPLLPKHLTTLSQARVHVFQLFHFSASPNYQSSSQPSSSSSISRNVRVSVWWDFENCTLPRGINVCKIAPAIMEAVRANRIKGPLHITGFGNVLQFSKDNQEALAYTGIYLTHIPNGGKNSADRSLLVDLMHWVSQNPPPAHLFLISGDKDFAGLLHRLRMNNYNILLATSGKASDLLCSAATIAWQWPSLIKGEDLTGKHLNHPPDGPFGSWYGNYKMPLENPFSAVEQSTSSPAVEIYKPTLESKPGVIPKSIVKKVRYILNSHPKGISIFDLRAELAKCDMHLDKSFYGHKTFSRFLLSIPNIQLQSLGNGNFCVRLIHQRSSEPAKSIVLPSTTSAMKDKGKGYGATPKSDGEVKNMVRDADETLSIASLHERSIVDGSKSFQQVPSLDKSSVEYVDGKPSFSPSTERRMGELLKEFQISSLDSEKIVGVADAQLSEIKPPLKDNEISKTKKSLYKSSKQSLDNDFVRSKDVTHKNPEKYTIPENRANGSSYTTVENNCIMNDKSENFKTGGKYEKPTRKDADKICRSSYFLPVNDSVADKSSNNNAETYRKCSTFFSWIRSWWPFSKSHPRSDGLTSYQDKMDSHSEELKLSEPDKTVSCSEELKFSEPDHTVNHSEEHKLSEHDKIVNHYKESKLFQLHKTVNHSEELKLFNLDQTVGHSEEAMLSELDQNDSHSGKPELFSSESFWSDMESFVFSTKGSLLFSQSRSREDMAHKLQKGGPLFLRSLTEEDILKLNQSNPHTGVSEPATETKCTEKSVNDILAYCQKLVKEVLRERPEGYNIRSFQNLFVNRHGYHLDIQKLGYKKLTSLLQIMPGAKLESPFIFPSDPDVLASDGEASILNTAVINASHAVCNSDSEMTNSATEDDNIDSPWEELGPIIHNSNHSDLESKLSPKVKDLDIPRHPDYEPIVLDDDSSESEGDIPCLTDPEEHAMLKCNEKDSSLLHFVDLYQSKEAEKLKCVDHWGNYVADLLDKSTEFTQSTVSKIPSGSCKEKHRSQKSYSFVADPVVPNKDKLIDLILDACKKTEESNMQN
ncbi:hypothetical protein TanjilG_24359 [Lupinus angustifolius]|uniref:HTH OST-type domain-containing protein n=1 Tax=Lupinus angustifolius TaxID=3871 RepID=A0A1J7FMW4_LUPAN|nr:hypothetical protein TanjilG_24359 [Lupinus angustifolius]